MASITISDVEDDLRDRLGASAAARGCSIEDEARRILRAVLRPEPAKTIVEIAAELFGIENGVELEPHPDLEGPTIPEFARK